MKAKWFIIKSKRKIISQAVVHSIYHHIKSQIMKDVAEEIGKDWGDTKRKLYDLEAAFNRRDSFISWLLEIKLNNEYPMGELWDEFEKYEQSDQE